MIGSGLLGLFVLGRRDALPRGHDLPLLALCGVVWFALYNVALNAGEQRVDAGTAAMIVGVGPLLIAALAGMLLGEGFPGRLLAGCGIAFVGVALIGLATGMDGTLSGVGVLLCVVAAAAYAVGVVIQKPIVGRVSALQVTFLCCLAGALFCLPFAPGLLDNVREAPATSLAWLVYLGVFATALAFTTWAYALKRTPAGRLGATTYLVPPLSIVLAWALLHESPPALALLGGALALVGVGVSRHRPAAPSSDLRADESLSCSGSSDDVATQ